jgi:tRNA threonylcarbamoyladenosine biosynthesis protein TsaB
MTWSLGIDSSSAELGLGLFRDTTQVYALSRYLPNSHAEHIAQSVRFLLDTTGLSPTDIERIGIAVGPGSFTGLRIGIAFVKGFALQREIKVLPVSSLESAAMGWSVRKRCSLIVAFDARRDQVFWARFDRQAESIARSSEDRLSPIEELREHIGADDILITDALGYSRSTLFDRLNESNRAYSLDQHRIARGAACARLAAVEQEGSARWADAVGLEPRYLRLSAPEEKLAKGRKNQP